MFSRRERGLKLPCKRQIFTEYFTYVILSNAPYKVILLKNLEKNFASILSNANSVTPKTLNHFFGYKNCGFCVCTDSLYFISAKGQ